MTIKGDENVRIPFPKVKCSVHPKRVTKPESVGPLKTKTDDSWVVGGPIPEGHGFDTGPKVIFSNVSLFESDSPTHRNSYV